MIDKGYKGDKIFKDDPKDEAENEKVEESRELLEGYKKHFMSSMKYYSERADRLEMLMARKSAKRWNTRKKQKMVRRLVNARTMVGQLEPIVDQVQVRLDQIPAA
jgi:hypothetical protein